jgi:CSLREA domain-containing protein
MYQLNAMEIWHQRREEMMREAENARLARRGGRSAAAALGFVAALVVASLLMLGASSPTRADLTFTVNSTADPGSGGCSGTECTQREAIAVANRVSGADTINFNIPGEGVKTIIPASPLPTITEQLTIDGYSQPGASPNTLAKGTNAQIKIELDGSDVGDNDGLLIRASDTVVRGLAINRFGGRSGIHNDAFGISITGVKIQGNFIGTDASGTQDLGNRTFGVGIRDAVGTVVGGSTQSSANTIAFNGGGGVMISGTDSTGNRVLSNSLFSNGGLGIDLLGADETFFSNVRTANDPRDVDGGPNGLQNKPTISSAVNAAGKTTIKGKLLSKPNQTFTVRFFSNPAGQNEGKKFVGQTRVKTSSDGKGTFTFVPSRRVGAGKTVTATATGVEGISEFSAPRTVTAS